MIDYPIPGEKWQHYKGGIYEIIALANHSEDMQPYVVYRSLSFGTTYARPFSMWHDVIDKQGYAGAKRFKKLK